MMRRVQDHFPALSRLALGGDAVVSWYNALHDPESRLHEIAKTYDGGVLLWIMALLGAVVVFDVLANDWTPDVVRFGRRVFRIRWKSTLHYRHFLLAGIAFCYAAQPFVAERSGQNIALVIFFYWNSFLNIAVAFLDAHLRHRGLWWQKSCS